MEKHKTCSFFGHRKIKKSEDIQEKVTAVVEYLIVNCGVRVFLFGSRSEFDNLCRLVVGKLKEKYVNIKRIAYTCNREACVLESERKRWEKMYSVIGKDVTDLACVDEEYAYKNKYKAGVGSYVERNREMIDDSEYCIFYYNENYKPIIKRSKQAEVYYQPASGTRLAYEYARKKGKHIINLYIEARD